jgi:hypothetical protein
MSKTYIADTICDLRIGMSSKYSSIAPMVITTVSEETIYDIEMKFKSNLGYAIQILEAYFDAHVKYNEAIKLNQDEAELNQLMETLDSASIQLEQFAEA